MASAEFVAWASVAPCQLVVASVEPDLVVAVVAGVAAAAGVLVGLVEAFLVAEVLLVAAVGVAAAVAGVAAAAAVAVAAGRDNYSPTDDSIRPTGLNNPVVQQLLLWLLTSSLSSSYNIGTVSPK